MYLGSLLAIFVYWYVVFSDTEFSIPVPDEMQTRSRTVATTKPSPLRTVSKVPRIPLATPFQRSIVTTARRQYTKKVRYSDRYFRLSYPGGDVPADLGMSVDLVIRSLRSAGIDLQRLVHEDLIINPDAYPLYRWPTGYPDYHIDHRRIAILKVFLDRYALRLTSRVALATLERWQSGDLVIWSTRRTNVLPNHIGVVSDRRNEKGVPYVFEIYSKDAVVAESRLVNHWTVVAHYRWNDPHPSLELAPKSKRIPAEHSHRPKMVTP